MIDTNCTPLEKVKSLGHALIKSMLALRPYQRHHSKNINFNKQSSFIGYAIRWENPRIIICKFKAPVQNANKCRVLGNLHFIWSCNLGSGMEH